MLTFLEIAGVTNTDSTAAFSLSDLLPPEYQLMLIGIIIGLFVSIIFMYIYSSLAFMSIGKKAGLKSPGVAWINPIISIFEASGMHWWPWPILVLGSLIGVSLIFLFPTQGSVILLVLFAVFSMMTIIWQWKMFKAISKPGWWALVAPVIAILGIILLFISPLIGFLLIILAGLVYFILIGIAAWSKQETKSRVV